MDVTLTELPLLLATGALIAAAAGALLLLLRLRRRPATPADADEALTEARLRGFEQEEHIQTLEEKLEFMEALLDPPPARERTR